MTFNTLAKLPYFTLESYKQLAGIENARAHTARVQLSRWKKAGHLIRLKRGVYMPREFYTTHNKEISFLPAVSAIIKPQSYISSTYILQRSGILTEITYPITAITLKNTHTVTNELGSFTYQHMNPSLYNGFTHKEYFGLNFYQAAMAKALFDYLYLRPLSRKERGKSYNLAEELRLNLNEFPENEREEFTAHVENSGSLKMHDVLENFQEYIWQH